MKSIKTVTKQKLEHMNVLLQVRGMRKSKCIPLGFSNQRAHVLIMCNTQCSAWKTIKTWAIGDGFLKQNSIALRGISIDIYTQIKCNNTNWFGTSSQTLMDNTDQKCFSCLLLAIECYSSLETSTAETYPGAKLGGQLELTHLCLQKPSRHKNVFYRCPVVIYSAQKNTLNSTKRGAGFNAQPGSCFSAPPAARADTGECFTAEQHNPLLLAWSGARPISLWSQALASTKGWCCLWSWGASTAARASALLEQMEPGLACSRQRKGQNFSWNSTRNQAHRNVLSHMSLSQCSSGWQTSLSLALLPAQAFVSYHNLALGLEREITTPFLKVNYCCFNSDKLEKGCQEVLNTFMAKFLQVSTQLQSTLIYHTMYRVEEHMHQWKGVKQSSIKEAIKSMSIS